MARTYMASISRTCTACGASNTIHTTEIRPCWKINCSRCGSPIQKHRGFGSRLVTTLTEVSAPEYRAPA